MSRIPFNTGRWTDAEHERFVRVLEAYEYGNWDAMGITFVPSRRSIQIQVHACQHISGGPEPARRRREGVQHAPGAGTSSSAPSPPPSLSPIPSSYGGGGFYCGGDGDGGGCDGDGGGGGFSGEGDVFDGDDDAFGGDVYDDSDSDGDGDGLGGGLGEGGDDEDTEDDNCREASNVDRAIRDRQPPQLPARRVWSRVGMSVEHRATHRNSTSAGRAMRRSFDVYDPLGIL